MHGRTHLVSLLCDDGMALSDELSVLTIVLDDCTTWYYYYYWCTPLLFALFDAGTVAYVPRGAKSSFNHQPSSSSAQPQAKAKLTAAQRASMDVESGDFLRDLRRQLHAAAFPDKARRRGSGPRHAQGELAAWSGD
jgi:hypothetical protein